MLTGTPAGAGDEFYVSLSLGDIGTGSGVGIPLGGNNGP